MWQHINGPKISRTVHASHRIVFNQIASLFNPGKTVLLFIHVVKPCYCWRKSSVEQLAPSEKKLIPSSESPPKLELKPLPNTLEYAFLGEESTLPVIISSSLNDEQKGKLLDVLKEHKGALGWTIADIKCINPVDCMHYIHLDENAKSTRELQRRLNPNMKEVVRTEAIKLLDASIIYPISDGWWVNLVQVVPKKSGGTVVTNIDNELIPTRVTTRSHACIDYRKLNSVTRKDHFPLPFIDQMLDRLAGHAFYCFLDGYTGYNQIPISPKDQENTTFTCPFGTFAYKRMLFGLCNASVTFQRCMLSIFLIWLNDSLKSLWMTFLSLVTRLINVYII